VTLTASHRVAPEATVRTAVAFPVAVFVVWRLVHALVVTLFGGSQLEATFAFDAAFYLQLLGEGYAVPDGGYAEFSTVPFFPGLAWVTGAVQLVVGSEATAAIVTANALAVGAFVAVWGAVRAWTDDLHARRATVALALFPTSYFLWTYYTEALLVAATAAAAWAGRRERHVGAAVLLAVAATARVVGVTAGPALALARVIRIRRVDRVGVLYVLGSLAGFGAVLLRQAVEIGDPLGWTKAQQAWDREFATPWTALSGAVRDVLAAWPGVAEGVLFDLATAVAVAVSVVVLWRGARRGRWPAEPALLTAALWAAPLFSRLIAGQIRFALSCWPMFLWPAAAWPRLPRVVRVGLVGVAVGLSVVLLRRLALGLFNA
jgi:hypothetical protein